MKATIRFFLVVLFIYSFPENSAAQLRDSLAASLKYKPGLYFNYGSQYSFISNQFAAVQNVRVGLDFNRTLKLGIGYNWLTKKYPKHTRNVNGSDIPVHLHFNYGSIYAEYTFFKNYHWEATIPAQIGLGMAYYSKADDKSVRSAQKWFAVYEPMMTIQYRFLRYLGVGCGIGYRLIIINHSVIQEQFLSPVLLVKSKLFIGDLWRDTKKWARKKGE